MQRALFAVALTRVSIRVFTPGAALSEERAEALATQETTPQGTVSYTYDTASRRQTMTVAGQPQASYGYDAANRLTSTSQGSSSAAIGYDNANRLTGITFKLGLSTLGDLNYEYDPAGQRDAVWGGYARTGLPTAVSSFTYNAANELMKIGNESTTRDANGSLTSDGTTTYAYDALGAQRLDADGEPLDRARPRRDIQLR